MCSLMKDSYINISKAFSSSLVERIGTSTILNSFVPIKQIAEAKGLKSTRSLRLEINKPESKYIYIVKLKSMEALLMKSCFLV